MDLAIVDATVWTGVPSAPGLLTDASVGIDDGTIVHVGRRASLPSSPQRVIDGTDLLVTPGLIDAHAHTGLGLARGLAQDVPEIEWMDRALGPVARDLTDDEVVVGSRLGVLEAIMSGVTTICEYTGDVRALVETVHRPAGIRTVAVETINEVADRPADGPYELDPDVGEAACSRAEALFDWAADEPLVAAMYGPQAMDMVTLETMDRLVEAARLHDRRLHVHVAQGGRERRQIQARYDVDSAVALLAEHDYLDERLTAAHCHGATADERATLAGAGVGMVGCPSSIGGIDGIIPPIAEYRAHGGVAAIGSDQAPGGGGGHALLEEVRQAWLFAKVASGDPAAMPAWSALRLATADAARVLGIDDRVGTIAVGMRADVACFDLTAPPLVPGATGAGATPIANLVAGGGRAQAVHVIVDGEFVVEHGHPRTLAPAGVAAEAREVGAALHDRVSEAWRSSGSRIAEAADGPFGVRHPDQ